MRGMTEAKLLETKLSLSSIAKVLIVLVFLSIVKESASVVNDMRLKEMEKYAFEALLTHPRTGIIYEAKVPRNMTGMSIQAVRLRSGSLRSRGFLFNEFNVPEGVVSIPYVKRLVLLYLNLGNWSYIYGPRIRGGFKLVAPVIGIVAYNYSSHLDSKQVDIMTANKPMNIMLQNNAQYHESTLSCVWFHLNGSATMSSPSGHTNVCKSNGQGFFSLVVSTTKNASSPSSAPSHSNNNSSDFGIAPSSPSHFPASSAAAMPNADEFPHAEGGDGGRSMIWKVVLVPVVGMFVGLGIVGLLGFMFLHQRRKTLMTKLEHQAEHGEALQTALMGNTRAPAACGIRTHPKIENDYDAP